MIALLLVGCPLYKEDSAGESDFDTGWRDSYYYDCDDDGDGYCPSGGDCDEGSRDVNPGEDELCNGLDDNCDGAIDEGVTMAYYADYDGDGFGDPGNETVSCDTPIGYSENAADCNDADSDMYPENVETCDGVDEDCDGVLDNAGGTLYADADADGFGDPTVAISADCMSPAGYVSNADDCDDTDPAIYLGAVEVCDGLDNDCDGTLDILADGTSC